MSRIIDGVQVEEYDGYDMSDMHKTFTLEEQIERKKESTELFRKALIANGIDPTKWQEKRDKEIKELIELAQRRKNS